MIEFFKIKILASRKALVLFLLLLLISAGLRHYRPLALTTFLDDQGRDVLVAAEILKEGDIPFIGPMTSMGSLYLGPLFYWAITPFLWLANFSPAGPILFVAFLGWLANIALFFLLAKYFNLRSAFIGSFLYALSPLIVQNSRFIWNPNPVPLFTLIFLWFFLDFWERGRGLFLFLAGAALGVLIQLHYVTGVLFLVALLGYLLWAIKNKNKGLIVLLKLAGVGLGGAILPLVPFILFEIKHRFINTRAGWRFVFDSGPTEARPLLSLFQGQVDLLERLAQEALIVNWAFVYFLVSLLVFLTFLIFFRKKNKKRLGLVFLVLAIFFSSLLIAVTVIRDQIHLHYLGLLLPIFFIIIGGADYFWQKIRVFGFAPLGLVNFFLFIAILFSLSRVNYEQIFQKDNNQQIKRAQGVAAHIQAKAEDKNIFVTSLTGSPSAYHYRYYLYLAGFKVDSLDPSSVFAICEGGKCGNPESNPLWEIAQFGVLEIVSAEQAGWGVLVYELKQKGV